MNKNSNIKWVSCAQLLLLPVRPRELSQAIGLDWWAAKKLFDDGWLSFNPEQEMIVDEGMESEFLFLGSLVSAGCDPDMLAHLLAGLAKPYRYRISDIYFDWISKRWRTLPYITDDLFSDMLWDLKENEDLDALSKMLARV